jgi:uncharacterized protein (TIRG00374 family)
VNKILRLLVSGVLLAWLAWRTDWVQFRSTFSHLRLELWFAAVGILLLTQVISAVRWRLLARLLGFGNALRAFIRFYFVGMFFNLLLPTSVGGDVVRAWYLDSGSGRKQAALLSVLIDRLSGLLILLALACIAELVCPIALPWVRFSVWATAGCAALGLLCLPLLARYLTGARNGTEPTIAKSLSLGTLRSALRALALSLSHALALLCSRPRLLLSTTVLSLLVQGSNVLLLWLLARAIYAPIPASYCGIVVPMVTLLTLVPVSLNGMGVREGGMVLFLTPVGIAPATALSLAFLWFSVFVAVSLFGAGVYVTETWSAEREARSAPPPPATPGAPRSALRARLRGFFRSGERAHDSFVGGDSDQGRARQPKTAA